MESTNNIKVGLFFGSDTGTTEAITEDFKGLWTLTELTIIEACDMTVEDYSQFDFIILGLPTWYDGDLQSDFEDFFDDFKTINFKNKIVAMYGLGDQYGYDEYFVDGLGILGKVILQNGGKIIGHWPIKGYDFSESKGQMNATHFYGLAIDEDNQMELTQGRLETWIKQVEQELKEVLSSNTIEIF
ncbi:MAG: flavodoxin [Bacteroidota bacterium]